MTTVYLNGEYKPLAEASINVLDRGFTFGDGVYEVIPVFNGKIFRFEEHYQRLVNSLKSIYMDDPLSKDQWHDIFIKLISTIDDENQSIYLQITRGVSDRDHDISITEKPTLFAMSRPIIKKDLSSGIKAIVSEDIRWQFCDIKAITLLPSVLLRHKAKEQGAKEAILHRNGIVTEGAASNIFIVKDEIIYTPPKNNHVLPGITRDLIVEILNKNRFKLLEEPIELKELLNADEVWVCSSTWEIVPVIKLDNQPVGQGCVGKVWKKVNDLYQQYKQSR